RWTRPMGVDQVYLRDVLTRLPLQKNHQNGRAAAAQREAAGLNIRPTNAVPVKVYFPDAYKLPTIDREPQALQASRCVYRTLTSNNCL
ncbi:MAG: hypothetical protein DIU59_016825, partial [Pseudomonadota bacterium]